MKAKDAHATKCRILASNATFYAARREDLVDSVVAGVVAEKAAFDKARRKA